MLYQDEVNKIVDAAVKKVSPDQQVDKVVVDLIKEVVYRSLFEYQKQSSMEMDRARAMNTRI